MIPWLFALFAVLPEALSVQSPDSVARLVAEAPRMWEVQLAPNGEAVIYSVARGSVASNQVVTELYLQRLTAGRAADGAPVLLSRSVGSGPATFTAGWCPRSDCVAYFEESEGSPALVRYMVESGRKAPIPVRDTASARPRITQVSADYRWSPSGKRLAFTAPLGRTLTSLDPRRGVNVPVSWWGSHDWMGLFVLDVASGAVTQVSPDSLHLGWSFEWAPDEHAMVFAATPEVEREGNTYARGDLYVVDLASRAVRALVVQPGWDDLPSWSPDGRWIAFRHERLVVGKRGILAVVPAAGGAVRSMSDKDGPRLGRSHVLAMTPTWAPDSRAVYFASRWRLSHQLFRVAVPAAGTNAPLAAPTQMMVNDDLAYREHLSLSADARTLAWTSTTGLTPPEIYIGTLSGRGFASPPRALTRLAPSFPPRESVRVDTLSWPSPDGLFQIRGVLVTPSAAWQHGRVSQPLPTLVNMKDWGEGTELGGVFWQLPLVERGYAVLMPQVRGRPGAGNAFALGLSDGKGYVSLPLEDVLAGIDRLIAQGISDSARLGVFGLSQGGTHTSGMITMTDRFKAAVVREAHLAELLTKEFLTAGDPETRALTNGIQGGGDAHDRAERARLMRESPVYNLDRVRTPTLLLFGAHAYAPSVGQMLFNGLQHFGVPSEHVVYDEGHGINRPAAVVDYYERTGAWFDYWLRDLPYPDPARQRAYDAWRKRQDRRATPQPVPHPLHRMP